MRGRATLIGFSEHCAVAAGTGLLELLLLCISHNAPQIWSVWRENFTPLEYWCLLYSRHSSYVINYVNSNAFRVISLMADLSLSSRSKVICFRLWQATPGYSVATRGKIPHNFPLSGFRGRGAVQLKYLLLFCAVIFGFRSIYSAMP